MKMTKTKKIVYTTGIATAVIYSICAFFVWIAPITTLKFFNSWFHAIDLTKIASTISFSSFLIGLVSSVVSAMLVALLAIIVYNKFPK